MNKQSASRHLTLTRQLGLVVALVFLTGFVLGEFVPLNSVLNLLLVVGGTSAVFFLFNRFGRTVSQPDYLAAAGMPARFDETAVSGGHRMRRAAEWLLAIFSNEVVGKGEDERTSQRYLATFRLIGLLSTSMFLFGYFWGRYSPDNAADTLIVIGFWFLIIYFLFDRLMQVVLGSRYRPAAEMPKWLERQKGYHDVYSGWFIRPSDPLVLILAIVVLAFGISLVTLYAT